MPDTRTQVVARSSGRCEAMVLIPRFIRGRNYSTWTRCFRAPVEVHHMLTRARGGTILDAMGETAHLIALCPGHHKVAHSPGGHDAGLMMNGYVTTGPDGSPVYQGSDSRLSHLQPVAVPVLREDAPDSEHGERL